MHPLASPCRRIPPWDWRTRLWWLLWTQCPGVGPQRIRQLLAAFGTLELAWQASEARLAETLRWSERQGAILEGYRRTWGANPLSRAAERWNRGRGVLLPGDLRWPATAGEAHPPAAALYWTGRGSLWAHLAARKAVAVVGTRRPSRHGLGVAREIGAVLARGGWPVVSGLAAGIDGAVHQGCLDHHGVPVGVLGTPLDRVYPREHGPLQAAVAEKGLLLSELCPGSAVSKGSFARRNRLQVALACAVVLVECPLGSGALHSAELAWKEGLPLWVVPADTGRISAEGSNGLLARGATPLIRTEDLLGFLGSGPLRPPSGEMTMENPAGTGQAAGRGLRQVDRLLAILGRGASMEELCAGSGCRQEELMPHLLDLEAQGILRAEPGLFWRPTVPTPTAERS